jgi:hypothetical protein
MWYFSHVCLCKRRMVIVRECCYIQ